ncbi:unnamed protein product [Schistocephalus solidus]|uniref:Reverse transcriptase domain-containing protein n=1 Tax=Schistocephalus solidus TaxID=70667 RepID=A0A183SDD2_SCHSO|nr:unnamed protein product [Schistocephalus solidus]
MWRRGQVPQDFKDATIVHLYIRKGNRAGKIFTRILLNRLNGQLEQGLFPESQRGFRGHRQTTDMIFAARQLQEKCQEMRTHLDTYFMDLTEDFHTSEAELRTGPTLFSLMFSAMLMDAYRDDQPGIRIAYRTDRHFLNSRCLQAPMRVSTTTVHDLLFADDCAINTVTEEDMQNNHGPLRCSLCQFLINNQQPHNINFCYTCLIPHDDDHPNH